MKNKIQFLMTLTCCHWRAYVHEGYKLWFLSDFPVNRCVLISPQLARFTSSPHHLPYFQVPTPLRRHIWESFVEHKVPPGAALRHRCLYVSEDGDSRGLCINPRHLTLGSLDDNRLDARSEEKLRQQLGYWQPREYRQLPPLPSVHLQEPTFSVKYDPQALHCWSGQPVPLDPHQLRGYEYCNRFSSMLRRPLSDPHRPALQRAEDLIRAIRQNQAESVETLIHSFVQESIDPLPAPKALKCAFHRRSKSPHEILEK